MKPHLHQFVNRESGRVETETFLADNWISFLYGKIHTSAPLLLRALTSTYCSQVLAGWHYDLPSPIKGEDLFRKLGIDWKECLDPPESFNNLRNVFERRIRYWETRPMDSDVSVIVSPADAKMLIGSFADISTIYIKESLFNLSELLGTDSKWILPFTYCDYAVFRLTPEKYHYNHVPVTGQISDMYTVDGQFHSCNPFATLTIPSIYSKNRRIVTIMDTNIPGGSQIGCVAMIEIVALMIGEIKQSYCHSKYSMPESVHPGMIITKGCPKSLFRPGSSTVVLLFEPGRITFSADLVRNSLRHDVISRFSDYYGRPCVETEVRVRSSIARKNYESFNSITV